MKTVPLKDAYNICNGYSETWQPPEPEPTVASEFTVRVEHPISIEPNEIQGYIGMALDTHNELCYMDIEVTD